MPLAFLSAHWLNTDMMVTGQAATLDQRVKPGVKNDKLPIRPEPPILGANR